MRCSQRLSAEPRRGAGARRRWRQLGLGAQILADLGVRRLRVLGTPRRLVGLRGFGLEVEGHEEPAGAAGHRPDVKLCRYGLRNTSMTERTGALRPVRTARYAIIASRWNPRIVDALVDGARARARASMASTTDRSTSCACPARGRFRWPRRASRARGGTWRSSRSAASCAATRATTSTSPTDARTA